MQEMGERLREYVRSAGRQGNLKGNLTIIEISTLMISMLNMFESVHALSDSRAASTKCSKSRFAHADLRFHCYRGIWQDSE